jgi:hypothetical protein
VLSRALGEPVAVEERAGVEAVRELEPDFGKLLQSGPA